jgi:hypothetical protein
MNDMKNYKKIVYAVVLATAFSCTENDRLDFTVEKPESIAAVEYLKGFDVLKTYINRTENPGFKLGSIIGTTDFESKNTTFRMIQSNFDEITFSGTELFHNAVVDNDGKINLNTVKGLINSAKESELLVFGHALCANSNQNGVYLNKLIAPQVFVSDKNVLDKSGLNETPFGGGWKEAHNANGGSVSMATSDGIAGGSASLVLTNGNNTTSTATRVQFPNIDGTQAIKKWLVSFCIKSNKPGQGRVTLSNYFRNRYPYTFDESEGATSIFHTTADWQQFQFVLNVDPEQVEVDTRREIYFSIDVGYLANVKYNIDIQTLSMIPVEGDVVPEYTAFRLLNDSEKADILQDAMQTFVSATMDTCKNVIRAWDVVSNPMSNLNPGDLISASEAGTGNSVFYWQGYLGKDYAVTAFNLARQSGNGNEKLFIADDNLFENPAKCNGLIEYITYIDGKGATVDGISTPLNVTLGLTDVQIIKSFFATLAATGKLVRISDLKIGIRRAGGSANLNAGSLTNEEQQAMSDFYKEIVMAYFEKVPASQRYGITLRNPIDNADAIGLWSSNYSRKHTYAGFVEGLKSE